MQRIKRVLVIDSDERSVVNLAYVKIDRRTYGAYYGYCGGGAFDYGNFYISPNGKVVATSDPDLLPKLALKICDQLTGQIEKLLDHDDVEGSLSAAGIKFTDDYKVFPSPNHLEYRSAQVDQKVLVSVSSKWALSYRWPH
jgi:hypothetical protein